MYVTGSICSDADEFPYFRDYDCGNDVSVHGLY